jgi:hypothetical protein
MTEQESWDRRTETGQPWQDIHDSTARHDIWGRPGTGQLGQDSLERFTSEISLDRRAGTESKNRTGQESWDRTTRQDNRDKTAITRKLGHESRDRTAWAKQPEQVSQNKSA